jgi:hypothetical protein
MGRASSVAVLEEPVELERALFALVLCSPNGEQSLGGLGLAF